MSDMTRNTYSPHMKGVGFKSPGKRALYRNQDETITSTVYHEYPHHKPFINDDYEHNPDKPVTISPENNRKAVISALKNLRDKIRKLELERAAAENNLKSLAEETHQYKNMLQKDQENVQPSQTFVSKHSQELESQLQTAECRSQELEKQLEKMRKLVKDADADRQDAVIKSTALMLERNQNSEKNQQYIPKFDAQIEKINNLEREQLKLTATQTLAENKIRDLEEKLKEERLHRHFMQEKAVELQSAAETNKILLQAGDRPTSGKTKKMKKKKKLPANKKQKTQQTNQPVERERCYPAKHYRLNLAEIPFVAGKSTAHSHSVGANVQRVLSLMKSHNMALCSSPLESARSTSSSSGSSVDNLDQDLADLLLQLQDEFGQMSFEHQELSKQINDVTDPRIREDLERELESLVSRMEGKSQQISKVRNHQEKLQERMKKKNQNSKKTPRSKTEYHHDGGEVEVTTTIKTKGHGAGKVTVRPSSAREVTVRSTTGTAREASLNVLKDMRKLQTTLRRDDLHWE